MAKYSSFNATNKLNLKQLTLERAKYRTGLFDESISLPKPMQNFHFAENQFYGKVDDLLNPVIANKQKLKILSTSDNLFALDFVKNQFDELKQNFVKCTTIGTISKDDNYLSVLEAKKAYESLDKEYASYMNILLTTLNKDYIIDGKRENNITDLNSYINHLIEFSRLTSRVMPLTKTSFLKTNFCPLNCSGLVIEIAELSYSVDSQKFEFIQSPNFEFYKNACIKHGFYIDYNAPWRLVADIGSPVMSNAMLKVGTSRQQLFQTHFERTILTETNNIETILLNGYNTFVKNRPLSKVVFECNKKLAYKNIARFGISKAAIKNAIDNEKLLQIYLHLRTSEQEQQISQTLKNKILSNSNSILKNKNILSALIHIEEVLATNQLLGSGTLNSTVLKLEDMKKKE
jgi:hypothetical protein